MYTDPSGEAFFIGLLIATITFALVNTTTQLVSDIISYASTGTWSSGWEDYAGAFLGGLGGGAVFLISGGNLALTFGTMGGMQTLATNLMTNATGKTNYSGLQFLGSTVLSAGMGFIAGSMGGSKIAGETIGKNSFMAVWKAGLTKLKNNTASKMSGKVMLKGIVAISVLRGTAGITGGIMDGIGSWISYLLGDQSKIGYI